MIAYLTISFQTKKKKIALLAKHNLSLLAFHLPLDAHPTLGNNWLAAKDMGWVDLEPFAEIGVRGRLAVPVGREAFQEMLEGYYQHPAHVAWGGEGEVRSVALISGGADRSLLEAAGAGVDAFVTGRFDEPAWHQAKEEGVHFFALGHAATERVGPLALGKHLQEALGVQWTWIPDDNPF